MKQIRNITPYLASENLDTNVTITLFKIHKMARRVNRGYKPSSHYQARIKHKRVLRRSTQRMVR